MKELTLSKDWFLASEHDLAGAASQETDCQPTGASWMRVDIPSTVQAALAAHGRAPAPWRDRDAEAFRAFENDTWWYRHQFELPPEAGEAERYDLLFEGVSLFATVWLNGSPVGFIRNAHHPHRFDISAHVNREGRNVLAVECRLDLERMKQTVRRDVSKDAEEIRPYMRLAQMCFGWDFAPRLPLIGLWRPVHLLCHREVSIDDLYVRTDAIEQGVAEITIEARMRTLCALKEPAKLHLGIHESPDAPALWRQSVELCGDAPILVQARLDPVRPWYPQPIGEPFRYHLDARIESGGTEIDRRTTLFGVRTVELKQDEQFTFCINGTDVFAKGANWVPSNSMSLESSPEHYRHLLRLARDAHFNMLRIWGGGIYEPETFYDLCDEFGIMVWQDFMYACAMYPDDDPAFMESASLEARHIVQRLRRHPSVVLWCGNNECQEAWVLGDWPDRARRHLGERLYDQVLPQTVRDLSPDVPYWPGSPYGGPTTRSREIGDFHDWYSLPNWRTYDANAPRFSSEYGFRSVPQRETVEAMISREFLWDRNGPQHNAWDFHHGRCGWLREILPEFGNPKTLDEYIMLTQEAQATLMRYAVEVYRRRMYATSGSLIWQYNEPWPAVTFSLVDFFGRPKAAYYWVRHACQPVMGMFYQPAEGPLAFWGVNDLAVPYECHVRLRRYDHKGEALGECVFDGRLMPNAATRLLEVPGELHLEEPAHEFLHAELRAGEVSSECIYHAALRRDWILPDTDLEIVASRCDESRFRVTLTSPEHVHFAAVSVPHAAAVYSDNFVDVLPGEPRVIEIAAPEMGILTVRAANAPTQQILPQ